MLKKGENLGEKVKSVESAKTVKMVNNIWFFGKKCFFKVTGPILCNLNAIMCQKLVSLQFYTARHKEKSYTCKKKNVNLNRHIIDQEKVIH
jgi:hypothetical protein